jgi:hypothetical protein
LPTNVSAYGLPYSPLSIAPMLRTTQSWELRPLVPRHIPPVRIARAVVPTVRKKRRAGLVKAAPLAQESSA